MKPILLNTLTFIKKHLFPLLCGVLALAAVVSIWYPAAGWYADLQKQLDDRASIANRITAILNHQRHLPLLSPDDQTPKLLTVFPRQDIIDEGSKAAAQVHAEATSLYQTFSKLNEHQLLTPGSLPTPSPNHGPQYQFRDDYIKYMASNAVVINTMHGTVPSTAQEIQARREDIWKSQYAPYVLKLSNGTPEPTTLAEQQQAFLNATSKLDLEMQKAQTEKFGVYVAPGFPAVDTDITGARDAPDVANIWQAQMLLWVQEDIGRAIASANTDPTTQALLMISEAPIKQLVRVDLSYNTMYALPLVQGGATPTPADLNAYQTALPVNFAVSPTGRVCNGMYDVIHFGLVMDVDADRLPQVLQDMCRGQLLTIYRVASIVPLDNNAMALQGFFYGSTPMVRVTVDAEDLYLRNWSTQYMPEKIKTMLGVPTAPPPTPGS